MLTQEKNEHEVGEALKVLSDEPGFKREDLWLTSKVWNSYMTRFSPDDPFLTE